MNRQQAQPTQQRMIPYSQNSFSGGINTSVRPELVGETEAVDILNFEYTDDDHLKTRAGVTEWIQPAFVFPSRITSLHYYENDLGEISILATASNKLYKISNLSPTIATDITGALVLPSTNFYQWRNYNGLAIGVNRATSGDNPIKFDGATAAALAGSPPNAKYIEVWNERLWLVSADDPNTVYGSSLGNPENWVVDGADDAVILDVGKNDGDKITGIYAFRGVLYVFKRTKIYKIAALNGSIPTDVGNLYVDIYASNIGCVSPYSIQAVLDDVLFLSDSGVASLVSAPLGELKTAIVSQKVKELKQLKKTSQEISSLVIEEANQYWLLVPASFSPRSVDEVYVCDVQQIQQGIIRWVRFEGKIAGTVACNIYINGERRTLIGGTDNKIYSYVSGQTDIAALWDAGLFDISVWDDEDNFYAFLDGLVPFEKRIITRAYEFNAPFVYKIFHRFGANITLLSDEIILKFRYYLNRNTLLGGEYNLTFEKTPNLSLWDIGIWDVTRFDGDSNITDTLTMIRQFKRDAVRKGKNVSFIISNDQNGGFILNDILLEFAPLGQRRINQIDAVQ